ncbi:hypothetical protein ADL21_00375 [Streptomyces albus subsp. albus]|nr:hypothetical protein ADL21_00375 [Streptomyces albus subsp. albus]
MFDALSALGAQRGFGAEGAAQQQSVLFLLGEGGDQAGEVPLCRPGRFLGRGAACLAGTASRSVSTRRKSARAC